MVPMLQGSDHLTRDGYKGVGTERRSGQETGTGNQTVNEGGKAERNRSSSRNKHEETGSKGNETKAGMNWDKIITLVPSSNKCAQPHYHQNIPIHLIRLLPPPQYKHPVWLHVYLQYFNFDILHAMVVQSITYASSFWSPLEGKSLAEIRIDPNIMEDITLIHVCT
ncbi:hypothetical protein BS47DRAFT_1369153 [Hydnum rufescens UP504]|uniref:Uncharacterized protein n=1 Tax=Hydnum rufescens UP504 TaxID=1448309 RepID=A0A9P6AE05_9AGAM|nr:hypothetical protein BS47DRAFT_1369153 [Hydnum rufescens UP504]